MVHSNGIDESEARWYAVWTRSRQEKSAAAMLSQFGIEHYLPLKAEIRQWSDRKQTIETPLFSGYLFVYVDALKGSRLQVLKAPGIVAFVGNQSGPLPIPDQQIEDIRAVLKAGVPCSVRPLFKQGDRVRVIRGALAGIEGTFVRANSESCLLVSIDMVRQSLAINVSPDEVEPISCAPTSIQPAGELTAA